uniref:Carboxypeptidase n=1 Tax=Oncorhynchus mykiss TaxID=8022 RepID=A0A8C7R236_ONCMY
LFSMIQSFLVMYFLAVSCLTWADYAPDEVTELPGMSFKPNYRQWSGYLKASPGKFLHYWFVTSQRDPLKDPVNVPFHVSSPTRYLFSMIPASVGYSYSDDQKYKTDEVADDNYLALQSFFAKFPNFTQNEFFIIGESYGGIYAPTLSQRVTAKINFKAFAVGNGLSSYALNDQSLIYFGYYHGLFGEQLWTDLNTNCCDKVTCNFFNNSKEACKTLAFSIVYDSGLNEYALYMDCDQLFRKHWDTFQVSALPMEENSVQVPPCINSTAQMNWLNRGDVRKALHVPDTLPPWDICSDVVGGQYTNIYPTVKDVYLKLLSLGVRALVYNGDTDMACNFLGDKWFAEQLNQKTTTKYQNMFIKISGCNGGEAAAFLSHPLFQDAGHMVPQWAPGPALDMFQSFLSNKPY